MTSKIKLTYSYLIVLVLALVSTFQYGDYVGARYLPILIMTFLCLFIWLLISFKGFGSKSKKSDFLVHFSFFLGLLTLTIIGESDAQESLFDLVKTSLPIFLSFIIISNSRALTPEQISKSVRVMSIFALIFLAVELYLRVGGLLSDLSRAYANFYLLKMDSPFMVDSNAVGLFALFYFAIYLYFAFVFKPSRTWSDFAILLFFLIFIALTFSRAAIFTSVLLLMFSYYFNSSLKGKVVKLSLMLIPAMLSVPILINFITSDGSGGTKLGVLANVPIIMENLSFKGIVFGFGINEGNYVYSYEEGKYSHVLIPMILGQFGLVGLVLYFAFFVYYMIVSKFHSAYVFIAMFVVGISYLHPFLETIFLANAMVVAMHLNKRGMHV